MEFKLIICTFIVIIRFSTLIPLFWSVFTGVFSLVIEVKIKKNPAIKIAVSNKLNNNPNEVKPDVERIPVIMPT